MKSFSRIIAIGLITGTVLSSTSLALAAGKPPFTDVNENITYQAGIEFLATLGIISGNPDGTYKPNNTLNRAEMLKILTKASIPGTPPAPDVKCFDDVDTKAWYAPYVCWGKQYGWVVGYENGKLFKPEQTVNVVEALKMTLEAFGIPYDKKTEIWYKGIVDTSSTSNYIPFDVSGFDKGLRRDQMADLITRIIKKSDNILSEYLGEREGIIVTYETLKAGKNLATEKASSNPGTGETGLPQDTETSQAPGKPYVVITSMGVNGVTTMTVKIYDPYKEGNSPIDSYLVERVVDKAYKPVTIITKEANEESYTIENIQNGEVYNLRFIAINTLGKKSEPYEVTITGGDFSTAPQAKGQTPDNPSTLIAKQENGSFTVRLGAPTQNGGSEIVAYLVEQKVGEKYIPHLFLKKGETENDEFQFANLDSKKSYSYRFFTLNANHEVSVASKNLLIIPKKDGEFQIY